MKYTCCERLLWHIIAPASLHICLVAGMIWLSIYEAAEGKMSKKCFGSMVVSGLESPVVKASFTGKAKAAFTLAAQQKRAAKAVRDNAVTGGDCCDFYICKKDSKWDRERKEGV